MSRQSYVAYSGATNALAAAGAGVTISAGVLRTALQIKPATKIQIIEWGYMFNSAPTAPIGVELIDTGTVFAAVTAHVAGSIHNYADASGPASQIVAANLGASATGYNATAEGTITATRLLGYAFDMATMFKQQFPLGREPEVNAGNSLRMRFTSAATITAVGYVMWEE